MAEEREPLCQNPPRLGPACPSR